MKNVLALDCSTKRTGWAVFSDGELIKYGAIAASGTRTEKRILKMRDDILDIIKEYNINEIIEEEVIPDGYSTRTGKVLMWLQGVVVCSVFEHFPHIPINFIGPSSWRSKLHIQGSRVKRDEQKQIDIGYVNRKFGLELSPTQDDEADAIGIGASYFMKDSAF